MKKKLPYRQLLLLLITSHVFLFLQAQRFAFRHLDVNVGLTSNTVAQVAFDHNGSLWFSTGEAINLFDGNNILQFHWRNYSFFPQSEVSHFSIDSYNRVWACYLSKLIMIDEKRKPQEVYLHDTLRSARVYYCFEIKGLGIVAVSNKGTYYTDDIKKPWKHLTWFDNLKANKTFFLLNRFDSSSFLANLEDKLVLINFRTGKLMMDITMPANVDACRINDDEIFAGIRYTSDFFRISISQKKITKKYSRINDESGLPIITELQTMDQAADNKIYMATRFSGLVQFDPVKETFIASRHDIFSSQSVSSDNLRFVANSPGGYLAVTSRSGINITNIFRYSFRSMQYFKDDKGNIIDEGVIGLVEDKKRTLWIVTQGYLLTMAEGSNVVDRLFAVKDISQEDNTAIVPGIPELDDKGKIWIPYVGYGIFVYNENGKVVKKLRLSEQGHSFILNNGFRVLRKADNGKMFVGTNRGIFIIDPVTYKIDSTTLQPLMNAMQLKRVVDVLSDGNIVWVSTSPNGAVYSFNMITQQVKAFTIKEGLASLRNYLLTKDKEGNIYTSSFDGVSVFKYDGKIDVMDEKSGLIDIRAEAVIADNNGYVWITNTSRLIKYEPSTNKFDYFDEQNGINRTGFLITRPCKLQNGEIVFGLNRGVVFVDPNQPNPPQQPVKFSLYKMNIDNTIELCRSSEGLNLPYRNARVAFSYLNSDIISGDRIFYRYKMEGIDTTWSLPAKGRFITYSLSPGSYKFHMQASYDEINWTNFPHAVSIIVAAPFWQQWWFYALIGLLATATTTAVIKIVQSSKRQKQKLVELNRLMNESRLMAIRSQMNPHFIFNSLNAIQETIVMQDFDAAYQYLSKFSKLLRQVLNNSEKDFIPLKDEIEVNQLYLELESLRFKKSFNYSFNVDENIDTEILRFPSLLLQPFIENAIWHGLMHKQGEKKLDISFGLRNNHLECVIEDNGIGRERSAEIKKNKLGAQYFESRGTKLSGQRIQLLNETGYTKASIQIDDLKKESGEPGGTRITMNLPLDYKT